MNRGKPKIIITLSPTIETADEESRSFWSQTEAPVEQPIVTPKQPPVSSLRIPRTVHYVPPDTLMYPLFSAIQRKAWTRAKKLCHELILCDPERKSYLDLYIRLDQITDLIDQRIYPQSATSQKTMEENDNDEKSSQQRSEEPISRSP